MLSFALAVPAYAQPVPSADGDQSANQTPAQEAAESTVTTTPTVAAGQDIVVTGSRIVRRDYESNSPIVTVGQQLFEQSSTAAIEQNLNRLPQFTPAKTPTGANAGDIQPNATNTPGSATISLRGIGANRNLVLLDGRRATPSNATGVVDITTIPSAAIDRVEIITGGASSTYGADAVAGVTNFVLKKNFSGVELDASANITEEGDGFEYQISGIMGANFDDGRGNVSIAMSTNRRDKILNAGRDFFQKNSYDLDRGGSGFIFPSPGVNFGFGNPVAQGAIDSTLAPRGPISPGLAFATVYTNPDGSVFTSDFANRGGVYNAQQVGGPYKINRAGTLATVFDDGFAQLPLTRYNFLARGNYEIADWISVFGQGYFSKVHTETVQEPGPIFAGWSASIPYGNAIYTGDTTRGIPSSVNTDGRTNAAYLNGGRFGLNCAAVGGCTTAQVFPLPGELQTLLLGRTNPNAPFTLNSLLPENRTAFTDVNTFNLTAGVNGKIPGIDWTYEAFVNHGESDTFALQTGIYSLGRVRALLTSPNFGRGFRQQGNAEQGGFGASTATCTSGLNFYTPPAGGFSNDCLEAIRADLKNRSKIKQSIWEANFQGPLFELPGGELRAAFGLSYRDTGYSFLNDTLTTQGRSFQDQALGIYPSGNSVGDIQVKEAYGELLIPILKDTPFFQDLSIELGGRISDYSTTGNSYTYKILGEWAPTDFLRFRGGYNRAERAPNIAELFLAPEQSFAGTAFGDVCSRLNAAPYSANPARNPTNAGRVETLCRALMDRSGDLSAKTAFYDSGAPQPAAGGGFAFPTAVGNPNLSPEKADTYTAGVVITSPLRESALLRGLRLTVDYYSIRVKDAIGRQSVDVAQQQCFDPAFNPTFDVNSAFCSGIARNTQNGGLGNVLTTFFNNGRFRMSGIDANLDWTADVGPGRLNLNVLFSYLLDAKSSELATNPIIDYAGTTGTTQNGLTGFSYDYRVLTTLGYSLGGARVAVQWQHLPSIDDQSAALVANTPVEGFPSYNLFNLQTSYNLNSDISFRFGVDNLLNKQPPLGGQNFTNSAATGQVIGGAVNGQFYDTLGRRYYFGMSSKF